MRAATALLYRVQYPQSKMEKKANWIRLQFSATAAYLPDLSSPSGAVLSAYRTDSKSVLLGAGHVVWQFFSIVITFLTCDMRTD